MAKTQPHNSTVFYKHEESIFENRILESSHGVMRVKVDFGEPNISLSKNDENDTFYDGTIDFGEQFQSNGTYSIEKMYCKQRTRRSAIFADLAALNVEKGNLLAVIDLG